MKRVVGIGMMLGVPSFVLYLAGGWRITAMWLGFVACVCAIFYGAYLIEETL